MCRYTLQACTETAFPTREFHLLWRWFLWIWCDSKQAMKNKIGQKITMKKRGFRQAITWPDPAWTPLDENNMCPRTGCSKHRWHCLNSYRSTWSRAVGRCQEESTWKQEAKHDNISKIKDITTCATNHQRYVRHRKTMQWSVKFLSLSSYMKIGALQIWSDYYSKTNCNLINCNQELPIYRW